MGWQVAGAIAGGILGGVLGGQRGEPSKSTINRGPGKMFDPYYQSALRELGGLSTMRPQYRSLYSGLTPEMMQAMQGLNKFGNQNTQDAGDYLGRVVRGDFLNKNPYIDEAFSRGADAVQARLGSQFSMGNRTGGGAYQGATGQALKDLANEMYGGNYQAERERMQQAAGMLPGIDASRLAALQAQVQAGQISQEDAMTMLEEENRKANFGYESEWDRMSRYLTGLNTLSAPYGSQTQTVQNPFNMGAGILGGVISGGQMGGILGGP